MKPLIRVSNLTDIPTYYVVTRYRVDGDSIVAQQKYDVTDQIEALFADHDRQPEPSLDGLAEAHAALVLAAANIRVHDPGPSFDDEAIAYVRLGDIRKLRAAARLQSPPTPLQGSGERV